MRLVFLVTLSTPILTVTCSGAAQAQVRDSLDGSPALEVLEFYIGRIVPTDQAAMAMRSEVLLEWGVGRGAVRFRGTWSRQGFPEEFVNGLVGWDPVDSVIRITGLFYHGAYFKGVIAVLDPDRQVVQRQWTGHYPDGRVVQYRETWTPVDADRFEWRIEVWRDGEWVLDLPPGATRPPIHRVIRGPR